MTSTRPWPASCPAIPTPTGTLLGFPRRFLVGSHPAHSAACRKPGRSPSGLPCGTRPPRFGPALRRLAAAASATPRSWLLSADQRFQLPPRIFLAAPTTTVTCSSSSGDSGEPPARDDDSKVEGFSPSRLNAREVLVPAWCIQLVLVVVNVLVGSDHCDSVLCNFSCSVSGIARLSVFCASSHFSCIGTFNSHRR